MNSSTSASIVPDWAAFGHYDGVASALMPVSIEVVKKAAIKPGDRVLDIGARTGNAAILAARTGGDVTAIDFSPGLLEIGKTRAREEGLTIKFEEAEVKSLPFADNRFDILIDVVSLIFVDDREAAVAEMARVTALGGRIVWTSWIPGGTVAEVVKAHAAATEKVLGRPPYAYTQWHDRDEMAKLFGAHGFELDFEVHPMSYTAPSVRAWKDGMDAAHPLAVACNKVLEEAGMREETDKEILQILEAGNENPDAFKVSFQYVIGTAKRVS